MVPAIACNNRPNRGHPALFTFESGTVKLVIALSILLAVLPAAAQIQIPRKAPPPAAEEESPARTRELNLRANQVNRCLDAKGSIVLQDSPCAPTPAPAKAASHATGEVIELSAMTPRERADAPVAAADDGATDRLLTGFLNGSWKLALLLIACYGLFRLARAGRERYRDRQAPLDTGIRGPRRVR